METLGYVVFLLVFLSKNKRNICSLQLNHEAARYPGDGWLVDYILFNIPIKNGAFIWKRHHYCWLIDWLFCVLCHIGHVPAAITVERLQNLGIFSALMTLQSGGIFIMQNMLWTGLRFCCLIQRTTCTTSQRNLVLKFMVRDDMVRVGAKIRFGQIHGYRRFHSKFLHG